MEGKYRLNAQSLFITYPQCDLDHAAVLSALQAIVASKKWCLQQYIVARELHEDGNPHYHCFLKLDRKVNVKDPRLFDIQGFHPNV